MGPVLSVQNYESVISFIRKWLGTLLPLSYSIYFLPICVLATKNLPTWLSFNYLLALPFSFSLFYIVNKLFASSTLTVSYRASNLYTSFILTVFYKVNKLLALAYLFLSELFFQLMRVFTCTYDLN